MSKLDPFENESQSVEIGGLTIENRTDRVSIYGDTDLTRDKKGLEAARRIATLLNSIVKKLESEDLPESVPSPKEPETVKNPFE
jgi:hypothetical protein